MLRVGQVAEESNVNIETIRFYERKGLLPEPQRSPSGYRQYSPETIARIRFIKRAQELGFTLSDVGELLFLRIEPGRGCSDVKRKAEEKISEIEKKIEELRSISRALSKLASKCKGKGPTSECPILEYLEVEEAGK